MKKLDGKSKDIVKDNIEKLKNIFPEIVNEEKIDFDKLKEILGTYVDDRQERYNFTWNGKSQARRIAQAPSTGTLKPCKEESVNWDKTANLFIEGDNLEVLKLLQKSYHKKVKMIYIDPPYNTGKDFIYKDDFKDNVKNYLEITGQVDDEGKKLSVNPETSGRYHTDWLNMMYPRLKLARNLLKDDGVIFISIDDNEVINLRKICDEIFGEENFEGHVHWRRRHNQPNDPTKMIAIVAEHILVYAKNLEFLKKSGVGKVELTGKFSNPDNDPRGDWASKPWKVGKGQSGTKYQIKTTTGKIFNEEWMGDKDTFFKLQSDKRIIFPNNGQGSPRKKYFKFEREEEGQCATNWWKHEQFGNNQEASKELSELFIGQKVFDNPKPSKLIKNFLTISNAKKNDIILDFFAGSCPTAHAVFDLNIEDDKKRKFIMVQLPEPCDKKSEAFKAGYKTIADIGKERIRRVIKKIESEQKEQKRKNKETLFDENEPEKDKKLDLGLKVFKLDSSNIKTWDSDFDNLEQNLLDSVDNIKSERSTEDVLYEILLKYGLDLTVRIEERTIANTKIYSVGLGALIICLEKDISNKVIEGMIELKEELNPEVIRIVFSDSSFKDDAVKTNAIQLLKQNGIEDIRSL